MLSLKVAGKSGSSPNAKCGGRQPAEPAVSRCPGVWSSPAGKLRAGPLVCWWSLVGSLGLFVHLGSCCHVIVIVITHTPCLRVVTDDWPFPSQDCPLAPGFLVAWEPQMSCAFMSPCHLGCPLPLALRTYMYTAYLDVFSLSSCLRIS